jgi:D-alanyl-D-alanine dipeptidase
MGCLVKRWRMLAVVLAFMLLVSAAPAWGSPAAAPPAAEGLVGLYAGDGERFLIREWDGRLELVYSLGGSPDEPPAWFTVQPLTPVTADAYSLQAGGPLGRQSAPVAFVRDGEGRGTVCRIGGKSYQRQFSAPEKGTVFRIEPLLPLSELRQRAAQAKPPLETGIFRQPELVEVVNFDRTIKLDIRYARTDNFMGMALYDEGRAFLQRPAAEALVRAHRQLAKYGYGIIIHDAYRPWYVTKMFWDATPERQKVFVADPAKGSRHNRGGAVDVSLYDLTTGRPLAMTSDYDEFSQRAYSAYPGGTSLQRWQRDLLRLVMEGEGFTVYPEEWWHFDYGGWQLYPIMNVRFADISYQ